MGKPAHGKGIEMIPDAWERFERAVDVVAKSPPQHRAKEKKSKSRKAGAPTGNAKQSKAKNR